MPATLNPGILLARRSGAMDSGVSRIPAFKLYESSVKAQTPPGTAICEFPDGHWLVPIRKHLAKTDKGRIGAFEELAIRVQCTIPKTGKALETSQSSEHRVGS